MVYIPGNPTGYVDLSIIPTYKCDLACSFCMYSAGPDLTYEIDLQKLWSFLGTVHWREIHAFGIYGGEPSISLPLYQKCLDMVPSVVPKFTITNGVWSRHPHSTNKVLEFITKNNMTMFISTNKEQRFWQNTDRILNVIKAYPNVMLKTPDKIQPMGRASTKVWKCSWKCEEPLSIIRLAITPYGRALFQNCDGIYPVVGTWTHTYESIISRCKDRHFVEATCQPDGYVRE